MIYNEDRITNGSKQAQLKKARVSFERKLILFDRKKYLIRLFTVSHPFLFGGKTRPFRRAD